MKNVILHIGLPKTGTTALQRYYFSKLEESYICYNPSSILNPLVQAIKLLDFGMLKKDDLELLRDVVKWQSNKISQNDILISSETLSQRLMKFDFVGRVSFLKSIFPNATIVLVLRYQPMLLRSLYQQHVSQNYLLKPEEVFVPFAESVLTETDRWKDCMKINVKEWDYTETIRHFRRHYGEKFHVLFFENYSKNLMEIGRLILGHAGANFTEGKMNSFIPKIPKINTSYDSATMNILLNIAHRKLAFHSYNSFDSQLMQGLMVQANQARYIFDATSINDFLCRIESKQPLMGTANSTVDKQLLRVVLIYSKLRNLFVKSQRFELPEPIKSYIECESKILNASLIDVVERQKIPNLYL